MNTFDLSAPTARRALEGVWPHEEVSDERVEDAYAAAIWCSLIEPGDGVAGLLVRRHGAAGALRLVVADHVNELLTSDVDPSELDKALKRWAPRLSERSATGGTLADARRVRITLVLPGDAAWPSAVDDLGDHAPLALWCRGDVAALTQRPAVALVGARASTTYGEHIAADLSAELAATGVAIVSGGAYGIDGIAHRAAVAAAGTTVALMAGGADRAYPVAHTDLLDEIVVAGGAVVSEVPCGSQPTKWRFLARNRIIAALADATVVVEAGWRSGSINTAGHAATLGRGLGAVPGPLTSATSAGCHRLLRDYNAACITSTADVRELLGDVAPAITRTYGGRTDDRTRVLDALSTRSARGVDDVAQRSGMSSADVETVLGLLLLEQEATPTGDGWRRLARAAP